MSETKTKYRVGFVLQEARCLNCDFVYGEFVDKDFFELKEDIFALVETKHKDFDNLNEFPVCKKKELQISFTHAVQEIV